MKVFLGGTLNSNWRKQFISMLQCDYFNPVVENWTPECQEEDIKQRQECDFVVYCITPKMKGCYSIAEVVDDSNKRPNTTIFIVLDQDDGLTFTPKQHKSLEAVMNLVKSNGAYVFTVLFSAANCINSQILVQEL